MSLSNTNREGSIYHSMSEVIYFNSDLPVSYTNCFIYWSSTMILHNPSPSKSYTIKVILYHYQQTPWPSHTGVNILVIFNKWSNKTLTVWYEHCLGINLLKSQLNLVLTLYIRDVYTIPQCSSSLPSWQWRIKSQYKLMSMHWPSAHWKVSITHSDTANTFTIGQ